ncbi:hypothetical protein DAI22_03g056400 [Oryza sativa Japonica Group]|nr:hypothetical protein DAI22_03g056400 [Oryza sativa Japonica Group]
MASLQGREVHAFNLCWLFLNLDWWCSGVCFTSLWVSRSKKHCSVPYSTK